jgi:hypothetical protein
LALERIEIFAFEAASLESVVLPIPFGFLGEECFTDVRALGLLGIENGSILRPMNLSVRDEMRADPS